MRQPKQKRSADTLERVIESAERLLREVHADDLTIAQVVEDSGVSVGSIYARFADKNGVFAELVSRFMRTTLAVVDGNDRTSWQQLPLREALAHLIEQTATIYETHRGALRAISLRARVTRTQNLAYAIAQYNERVGQEIFELLMLHEQAIEHPNPPEAVRVCIDVMSTLLRDQIVHHEKPMDTQIIVARTTDLLCRFLRCPTELP